MPATPLARLCCLDLDTFFVSVERLLDPTLEGKPVVVGGRKDGRGVVTAASYEVRPLGVRSGIPVAKASRLAPHAIFLPGRPSLYAPYAQRVRAVLERFTPVVQTASIDEFFLDFHRTERLYRRPSDDSDDAAILRVVQQMRAEIRAETGLPASAGIGTTRAIAKIASGRAKPDGALLVPAGGERSFLRPLPVRRYPGIGPKAEERLLAAGLETLGDLLALEPGPLRLRFGGLRARLERDAAGLGRPLGADRPAFREHDPQGGARGGLSNERTFSHDLRDETTLHAQLQALCERVAWRARRRGVVARTLTVRIRYADFHTITRSDTGPATAEGGALTRRAWRLFSARDRPRAAVRLLGVGLSNLVEPGAQLPLPLGATQRPVVSRALDAVRDRFGFDAIQVGPRRLGRSVSSPGVPPASGSGSTGSGSSGRGSSGRGSLGSGSSGRGSSGSEPTG